MLCELNSKGTMLLREKMNINNKEGYFCRKKKLKSIKACIF